MATGKTAVAKSLAKRLKYKYISTDDMVERTAKMKISGIFEKHGEKAFRDLETKVLLSLKDQKNAVISCGGGIILKPQNIKAIKKLGPVFLLKASADSINSRLGSLKNRPILNISDNKKRMTQIKRVLRIRNPLYKRSADHVIDTDSTHLGGVVAAIISITEKALHVPK